MTVHLLNESQFSNFNSVDHEFSDDSSALIREWCQYYGDQFLGSDVATLTMTQQAIEKFPLILSCFCDFCYGYHLQKPGQWTTDAVKDVCIHIMPRKVMANEEFFVLVAPTLSNFIRWMSTENYLTNTTSLQRTLLSIEAAIIKNANNPSAWGMAKSLMMGSPSKINKFIKKSPKKENEISTLEDIIDDLRYLTEGFPLAAIQAALSKKNEMTPVLLGFLNHVLENYKNLETHYFGHLYALFSLAHFREKAAFPLVMRIASLPGEWPEDILGDAITEDLNRIIGSTYDGNIILIQQLIEDEYANTWSRDAAMRALLVLVKSNQLERSWVMNYFKQLFSHPSFINDELAMANLVSTASDLYPEEVYEEIAEAFKNNRVDISVIDLEWVDSILLMQKEQALKKHLYQDKQYDLIDDVVQEMHWWACFREHEAEDFSDNDDWGFSDDSEIELPYCRELPKIGRNEPCPCGSGKKYKKCCLQ